MFSHIFNYPGNYWDGASIIIKHILDQEGGDINGKNIALVYHNSAYGKDRFEPSRELSKKHGFNLSLLPVDHPGQEQKSQWLQIRREQPDYVLMWGWGVMNQVAIKRQPTFAIPWIIYWYLVVWIGNDVLPAGAGADGYKAVTFHGVGLITRSTMI